MTDQKEKATENTEALRAKAREVHTKVIDAQIALNKAWIDVDELNKRLIAAGLGVESVRCW